MITYRVRLDVPRELVLFVSRLLARHRKETGTRKNSRSLGCYRQAMFVLAWYRDKPDIPRLGARRGSQKVATDCTEQQVSLPRRRDHAGSGIAVWR